MIKNFKSGVKSHLKNMIKKLLILCIFITSCAPQGPKANEDGTQDLRIGAFNIQIFGASKYNNVAVRNHILQILPRYDIVLIQEIREASNTSFPALVNDLNQATGNRYGYIISSRLGRSSSKEQYAYIYDRTKLSVESSMNFNDASDVFEREPFLALFKSKTSGNKFFLAGLHSKPDDAYNELLHLESVISYAETTFGTGNGMALGDFNSDCTYLSDDQNRELWYYGNAYYRYLFPKDGDSTVGSTNCQYDQILISYDLTDNLYPNSESVFDFKTWLGISQSEAEAISDHFPVEALFAL